MNVLHGTKYPALDTLFAHEQQQCWPYQIHADSLEASELDECARYPIDKPFAWVKADVNQDGKLDLLVNYGGGYKSFYCFLNQGQLKPIEVEILGRKRDYCRSCKLVKVAGQPAIAILEIAPAGYHKEAQVWQDTLVYRLGAFVEYNAHPGRKYPQKIVLRTDQPSLTEMGWRRTWAINLRSGWVSINPLMEPLPRLKYPGAYPERYRLGRGVLDTLRQQLAYLNVKKLKSEYYYAGAVKARLTLTYAHQPEKKIEDKGARGMYGLYAIYSLITAAYERIEQRIANNKP